jgi:hypothetical protein
MRRDDKGRILYRHVDIKIIYPEGRKPEHKVYRAAPRKGFHEGGIDNILMDITTKLEERHKLWEFRLVPRGANAFTFVYAGLRERLKVSQVAEEATA